MERTEKQLYEAPSTQMFEVKVEGVVCASVESYPKWDDEDI